MKKTIAVILVMALLMSTLTVLGSAASVQSEPSIGYEIGTIIGSIIFSPFILIDGLLYLLTGYHWLYPNWN